MSNDQRDDFDPEAVLTAMGRSVVWKESQPKDSAAQAFAMVEPVFVVRSAVRNVFTGFGSTPSDARSNAIDDMRAWLRDYVRHHEDIAAKRDADAARAMADAANARATVAEVRAAMAQARNR